MHAADRRCQGILGIISQNRVHSHGPGPLGTVKLTVGSSQHQKLFRAYQVPDPVNRLSAPISALSAFLLILSESLSAPVQSVIPCNISIQPQQLSQIISAEAVLSSARCVIQVFHLQFPALYFRAF